MSGQWFTFDNNLLRFETQNQSAIRKAVYIWVFLLLLYLAIYCVHFIQILHSLSIIITSKYFLNHEIPKISTALSSPFYTYKCQEDIVEDKVQHLLKLLDFVCCGVMRLSVLLVADKKWNIYHMLRN